MSDIKAQLHQSMISMLYGCGEQFRRRYGARFGWNDKEEIIPPGVALIIGISTHKSVEHNLTSKINTGELLPLEEIKDIARDDVATRWKDGVALTKEESKQKRKTKGSCIDTAVSLSELHAVGLAPTLNPKAVERKWVVTLDGFPFDLSGAWDVEEKGNIIRDTKTSAKSPSQGDADSSEQLTMYSLAMKVCDNKEPKALFLDHLVKTKTPKIVTLKTRRTAKHRLVLLRRIEIAAEVISKGAFVPANPMDWRCSPKFCGYWNTCKFANK